MIGSFGATGTPFLHTFTDDLPGRVKEKRGNGKAHNDIWPKGIGGGHQSTRNDYTAIGEQIVPEHIQVERILRSSAR